MKIIGLTGTAGSGKDTAAGFAIAWCEANGLHAERVALADPLKESAAAALGYDPESEAVKVTGYSAIDFCNDLKQPGVKITVDICHNPGSFGPEPEPPEFELLAELTGRQYLQFYGTEAHRGVFGEDFWTNVTKQILHRKEREGVDVVFITDVRFDDEAQFVHAEDDWHGEVWRIHREQTEIGADAAGHASEGGILADYVDLLITNDGPLDDLRDAVRLSCETIDWSYDK